jgi:DNA mismatch repair protein PMS2
MENLDILAANGFGLSVDEDAPYGRGERIRLTAMPTSKETVFDEKGI